MVNGTQSAAVPDCDGKSPATAEPYAVAYFTDYVPVPLDRATVNQTTRQVTILIEPDRYDESDNTFFVNLSQPVNAVIDDGRGLGTIVNDD